MEKKELNRKFCAYCAARQHNYNSPKEMLKQMIWVKNMTEIDVAKDLGIQQGSVSALMKRFGVKGKSKGRRKNEIAA